MVTGRARHRREGEARRDREMGSLGIIVDRVGLLGRFYNPARRCDFYTTEW